MQNPTGRRTVYTQGSDRGMNCEMPVTKTLSWGQEDIQVCILSEADEARRGLREARDFFPWGWELASKVSKALTTWSWPPGRTFCDDSCYHLHLLNLQTFL